MQRQPHQKPRPQRSQRRKPAPPAYPAPPPPRARQGTSPPGRRRTRHRRRFSPQRVLLLGAAVSLILGGLCILTVVAGLGALYGSDRILPGVSSAGVDLGNKSEDAAAAALAGAWDQKGILLRDGHRTWAVSPAELGVTLDAGATARAAFAWGRSNGGLFGGLRSLVSGINIDPILSVDLAQLTTYLDGAKFYVELPATNAGVRLVNGQAVASPAADGRALDITATTERLRVDAAGELADGALDLVMVTTYPDIVDAAPLVAQANALLTSPFAVNAYDPLHDESHNWVAPPEVWAAWLTAESSPASPTGLSLVLNAEGPAAFLQANGFFADERYIKVDEAVIAMQAALARSETQVTVRVWHDPTVYTVRAGQTLAAIAEEIGVPYPFIQAVNAGVNTDQLVIGQTLNIPSKDILMPLDPVPHKRIVVSRSQQHLWAYENGQVLFDWVISTGLPSSPTALGVFQVQSHELNAYADQWNLYMPHFMGFYHPGPNMALMNGFHGFPTRGGGYLLWAGDLGHPVTYGCVLLGLENAEALYNWAEDGVIVEVKA